MLGRDHYFFKLLNTHDRMWTDGLVFLIYSVSWGTAEKNLLPQYFYSCLCYLFRLFYMFLIRRFSFPCIHSLKIYFSESNWGAVVHVTPFLPIACVGLIKQWFLSRAGSTKGNLCGSVGRLERGCYPSHWSVGGKHSLWWEDLKFLPIPLIWKKRKV